MGTRESQGANCIFDRSKTGRAPCKFKRMNVERCSISKCCQVPGCGHSDVCRQCKHRTWSPATRRKCLFGRHPIHFQRFEPLCNTGSVCEGPTFQIEPFQSSPILCAGNPLEEPPQKTSATTSDSGTLPATPKPLAFIDIPVTNSNKREYHSPAIL